MSEHINDVEQSAKSLGAPADLYQRRAEAFFYQEAALLDEWRLADWLELMADDVTYRIPPLDLPSARPGEALYLIDDDRDRLESRVNQLMGKTAWAETPRSRTRRLLTNVRVTATDGNFLSATCNFAVWRFQYENTDIYVGRYEYRFIDTPNGLRVLERKAVLDLEALRPHGRISFIL
jgi:p-cumate 2,3-dioxygenase beta subunit